MMERSSLKRKRARAIISLIIMLVFWGLIFYYVGKPMVKFFDEPEKFRLWVDSHGLLSRIVFIGMVILQVIVAIIPGEPLEIGAGYAFGALEGTLLCIIGMFLGSLAIYFAVKKWGVRFIELFIPLEKLNSLKLLKNEKKFTFLFFIIYAVPGTPKDILTYFAPLTKIKFSHWLLICTLGRIPSVITSTVGGDALGLNNYTFAVIVFGITLLLSILGMAFYKRFEKQRNG